MMVLRAMLLAAVMLAFPGQAVSGVADNVVVSVKPLHSLVSAVMAGVGSPYLLVKGNRSPHDYTLKPSDAVALENANVVFWLGPELERFLVKPVATLSAKATVVELADAPDLIRLNFREDDAFEHHDDHSSDGDEHAADEIDMHLWLDPVNAAVLVSEIEGALKRADPDNAGKYAANARSLTARLEALVAEIKAELAPVAGRPYIVFHDAYQYFETRFGVHASAAFTVNPDVKPGAGRLREIQEKVKGLGALCIFAEPQFDTRLVDAVISGADVEVGVLDPLGSGLAAGPEQYFQLIRGMAASIKTCLMR